MKISWSVTTVTDFLWAFGLGMMAIPLSTALLMVLTGMGSERLNIEHSMGFYVGFGLVLVAFVVEANGA
jgi:hypothetical protein